MMYRLLKDLTDWKFNFYRKCKSSNILVKIVLISLALLGCVQCTASGSQKSRVSSARVLFEHGIFRHDKPSWDTNNNNNAPYPPRSDINSGSNNKDVVCQNAHGCQTDSIVSVPPADNKDRYTYDRFKRSVTTLNFHPKPKNVSKNVGLKPLRIFKYVTEDDVLKPSNYERRVTIFHPIESGGGVKREQRANDTNHQQIIGGAKVNLKAKLDKGVSSISSSNHNNNAGNHQLISNEANSELDSESKSSSRSKVASSSLKPENIVIFKPSLAIRKKSNKTSLIPSGNHPHIIKQNGGGGGGGNGNTVQRNSFTTTHEEPSSSPDPNSSTVNDRSLIQSLYFDSVVMLNEEGQKQLLDQQHQSVESHREKTSSKRGGGSDDEIKNLSATPPSSSSSTSSSDESKYSNATIGNKNLIIRPSSPITNNDNANRNTTTTTSIASGLVENLIQAINATIRENNKDNVIFTVKTKGKKGKKSNKQKLLDEDDSSQDGSERSRRSPFKTTLNKFQPPIQRRNSNSAIQSQPNGGQLARAALFRRTTASRYRPTAKVFIPRIMSPQNHGKFPIGRTILPMRAMSMGSKLPQNFQMVNSGPVGPGPVGPPIAAIKVTNLNAFNGNNKNVGMSMQSPAAGGKEMTPDASRTIYSYKPLPADVLLQQESSYYSPTYKRFKNRFEDQIMSMMESQKGLDDPMPRWETDSSRFQSRPPSHSKLRSRSSADRERHRNHRHNHHHERRERERERERERQDRERDRERQDRERDRERQDRDRERDRQDRERERPERERYSSDKHNDRHRSGHPRQSLRGKKISNPKYTYPKNAENIQDILRHFDKDQYYGPPMPNSKDSMDKPGHSEHSKKQGSTIPDMPSHPKLADLSGEFKDVHASLLKDIKEFAKRPNLFRGSSSSMSHKHSLSHHPFESNEGGSGAGFDDPIDEIFGSGKPKPVRDLIKPDLYSLENIRERIAFKRGKLHGKHRDKDHGKNYSGEKNIHTDGVHTDHHADENDEEFYDSHRPSRHNGEEGHSTEHIKSSLFSKEMYDSPSSYSKRNKYKESHNNDDSLTIFPSSHYHRDKEQKDREREHKDTEKEQSSPFEFNSAEFRKNMKYPLNKPIVLKRPNEPFRVRETEPKKKPEHDYFWNTYSNFEKQPTPVTYDAPLVLKSPTPQVMQSFNPFSHHTTHTHTHNHNPFSGPVNHKPMSLEEEDIVEIHTGGPGGSASGVPSFPAPDPHVAKQDKLQKMYMDVLQQKMQLEAALYRPQASPSIAPRPQPQMSHIPQMSQMPQMSQLLQMSNPVHMQQHRPQQQISAYPTNTVTLPPLPGMSSMRKKKPMRMKIHIYPNGNEGLEQGIEAANLLAGQFGTSGFSASNPPGVVAAPPANPPPKSTENSAMTSGPSGPSIMQSSPTGFANHHHHNHGQPPGPMGPGPGKKNVVLHLHVHRRNDHLGQLEVEAEGSNTHPVTAKPLSYKEIFDEQMKSDHQRNSNNGNSRHNNHQNHRQEEEPLSTQDTRERGPQEDDDDDEETERDKSVSMEVPIHDEKVEDVLHSLMKHRNSNNSNNKPDSRKRRS